MASHQTVDFLGEMGPSLAGQGAFEAEKEGHGGARHHCKVIFHPPIPVLQHQLDALCVGLCQVASVVSDTLQPHGL